MEDQKRQYKEPYVGSTFKVDNEKCEIIFSGEKCLLKNAELGLDAQGMEFADEFFEYKQLLLNFAYGIDHLNREDGCKNDDEIRDLLKNGKCRSFLQNMINAFESKEK